jgi:uncharacterized protein
MESPSPHYPRWSIDSMPYWEGCRRKELLYQHCDDCNEVVFHARAACPYCLSERLSWHRSAGEGALYSFSVQHFPVDRNNPGKLPLTLGIVELDEGFHMFTEIDCDDPERLRVGTRVSVYFETLAPDLVLPKFALSHSGEAPR